MGKGYVCCVFFVVACAGNSENNNFNNFDCGDGHPDYGEECDDGNTVDGDGCSSECLLPHCGDDQVDPGEECDDGNLVAGDGCSSTCENEACGDHVKQTGEECDDGNNDNDDGCSSTCKTERCGDHVQQASEECDDGNVTNNDGCSSTCKTERCGDHVTQASEGCDDGNLISGDGCSASCTVEVCGNHVVDADEGCDDGNVVSGDGCSSNCQPELTRTIVASWVTHDVSGATQSCLAPTITFHYRQIDGGGAFIGPDQTTSVACSNGFVASALLVAGRYRVYLDDGGVASSVEKIVDVQSANGTYSTVFITNGGYFKVAWRLIGVTDPTPHDCAYFGFGANGKVKVTTTLTVAPMTATTFDALCVDGFLVTDIQALPANTTYTVALDGRSSQSDPLGHLNLPGTYMILTHNQITDLGLQTLKIPGF